jgi:predicted HTH transcriptional regulator
LANGGGGIIIHGLTEKNNKPDQLDPIKEKKFSREYLDQVIAMGIQPPIKLKTEPIPHDGGYLYVMHVEPGETAHMSLEQKRYCRRYNFIAVPMEDYEIRDI